jgi:hypothetical protein
MRHPQHGIGQGRRVLLPPVYRDGSYMEMVKTPGNRRRLMISISLGIFAQWAGNGVISIIFFLISQLLVP